MFFQMLLCVLNNLPMKFRMNMKHLNGFFFKSYFKANESLGGIKISSKISVKFCSDHLLTQL